MITFAPSTFTLKRMLGLSRHASYGLSTAGSTPVTAAPASRAVRTHPPAYHEALLRGKIERSRIARARPL
ncbi:hypothetical protein Q5752_002518 [Cryptotrichosporon argae]